MKVFLLKDVEKVGMAGEIITVSDGYGANFLIPRKLGIEVTLANEGSFKNRIKTVEKRREVIESKTSMLAERIAHTTLTVKVKAHDSDRLYGAIDAQDIVDLLAAQSIPVAKNQIILAKSIKKAGIHKVTIKLSARLQPQVSLKVVPDIK